MRLSALLWLVLLALSAAPAEARILPSAAQAYRLLPARQSVEGPLGRALSLAVETPRTLTLLDDGGGAPRMSYSRDKVVAILLAAIPGFGLGHFWINDDNGFFTFLIVDAVVWTAFFLRGFFGVFSIPIVIILVAVKIWQIIDVMRVSRGAGGDAPVLEAARSEVEPRFGLPVGARAGSTPALLSLDF